jgi:flavin reductase (DIM6/NTAB) family NADH-FMN oxidoreductase RutF
MTELQEIFKSAMRKLAATVTVITLVNKDDGQPMGMAATAVCSLSFEPPSILFCINKSASLYDLVTRTERFGVNILSVEQQAVAERFADPRFRASRFEGLDWLLHGDDVPLLTGAQASLLCRKDALFHYGSHMIVVGEVIGGQAQPFTSPLLYVDRAFARHLSFEATCGP